MFCTKCGTQIPDGVNFCGNCGHPVPNEPSAQPGLAKEHGQSPSVQGRTGETRKPGKLSSGKKVLIIGVLAFILFIGAIVLAGLFFFKFRTEQTVVTQEEEVDKSGDVPADSMDPGETEGLTDAETGTDPFETEVPPEGETEALPAEPKVWAGAFAAYLREMDVESRSECRFGWILVDDNTMPEVVLEGSYEAMGSRILSYDWIHEKVDVLQTARLYFDYIERGGLLNNSEGHMGYYYDYIYELKDGAWQNFAMGEYYVRDNSVDWDYDDLIYEWNGEIVTEDDYAYCLQEVYPSETASTAEAFYSYDEMLSLLEYAIEHNENFVVNGAAGAFVSGLTDWGSTGGFDDANGDYFTDSMEVHRYEIMTEDVTWQEAELQCRKAGGYLVRINSTEEYRYVKDMINEEGLTDYFFWLGGRYDMDSGYYRWYEDGRFGDERLDQDAKYRSCWLPGEPSYYGWDADDNYVEEDYLEMFYSESKGDFVWNDAPPDISRYYKGRIAYICEYE